jgi:isoaspartyl peptidase/L-asparaginase-like protein (Ntn-hydrolase superfamily)
MSNYTKTTNFATKDSLPSGNAAKIVRGTEIDAEFNNIQIASATKADSANATLTGTTTAVTLDVSGTLTAGTITGGSY